MCAVSMIGDHFSRTWQQQYPQIIPLPSPSLPPIQLGVSREEFDALRRDVQQMHELLRAAKRYDTEHGEPDCEMEEKVALLKRVAELVGVNLSDVFGSGG
jgi:hypothetical protein